MTVNLITLHEDEQSKVVQISGEYHPLSHFDEAINELKVSFASGGLELFRIHGDENKQFGMSVAEADAFFKAYETFKTEQFYKKIAEGVRQAAVIAEAEALVAELPIDITLHPNSTEDSPCWQIKSESIKTISYHAYHVDQLLERVQHALKDYERYQQEQVIHDQVKTIREGCKAIQIHGQYPWHVAIAEPDLYGEYAHAPEELLERVKQAAATYDRWQAEEDLRIQERERLIGEANALAASCPAITINPPRDGRNWCIVMETPGFFQLAHSPRGLLDAVQAAKARHEQWQADQAIIQQEDDKWRSDAPIDDLIRTND